MVQELIFNVKLDFNAQARLQCRSSSSMPQLVFSAQARLHSVETSDLAIPAPAHIEEVCYNEQKACNHLYPLKFKNAGTEADSEEKPD